MEKSTPRKQIFIDPVCFMEVTTGKNALTFTHKMRTFYFCAESCRKAFKTNPDKYLESKSAKRKGWRGRYLARLNKITGNKPPKCH